MRGGTLPARGAPGEDSPDESEQADRPETDRADSTETKDSEADAPDWATSFQVADLPDSLTDRKVLLVAAGGQLEEGRAAADALRQTVDETGAPLVMDSSNLGDVADRNDQGIVEAASNLPVEAVVVVRVFAAGETPNAVVSSSAVRASGYH